jgi:hypothetical protein
MAQQSIIGGLFGLSPEMYQQQMMNQQEARALQMAQLDPASLARFGMIRAGQETGRGLAGLMGVEDPQLAMVRDVQQMRTQFDVSTPQGLRSFAQALGQRGYTDLAVQAAQRAAEVDKDLATAEQKRTEKLPNIANLQLYRDRLIQAVGPNDPRVKEVDAAITAAGKGTGTTINMAGPRQILSVEAKKAEDLQKKIDSGYTVLERLNEQQQAIEQGMIGGSFADTRTALATFASSIGLADQRLVNSLANSKSFKANQNALAAAIAKQLGVNPTDKDFQASLDQFARNSDDPKASLVFIKQMKEKFGQRQKINEDMFNSYIENDGTFRNYKGPKMVESFSSSNELEQLLAEKNKRTNKK